jgi:hypothetical protein
VDGLLKLLIVGVVPGSVWFTIHGVAPGSSGQPLDDHHGHAHPAAEVEVDISAAGQRPGGTAWTGR